MLSCSPLCGVGQTLPWLQAQTGPLHPVIYISRSSQGACSTSPEGLLGRGTGDLYDTLFIQLQTLRGELNLTSWGVKHRPVPIPIATRAGFEQLCPKQPFPMVAQPDVGGHSPAEHPTLLPGAVGPWQCRNGARLGQGREPCHSTAALCSLIPWPSCLSCGAWYFPSAELLPGCQCQPP